MPTLHDDLERAIQDVLQGHPDTREAMANGPGEFHGRGSDADALQDLIAARNALLDAATRWEKAG